MGNGSLVSEGTSCAKYLKHGWALLSAGRVPKREQVMGWCQFSWHQIRVEDPLIQERPKNLAPLYVRGKSAQGVETTVDTKASQPH